MREVKDRVTYCSICSNITDTDPCYFCTHPGRDQRLICVVEEPENVTAIEKTRDFKGVYHVLMGALSPLHGVGPDDLKIRELLMRVGNGGGRRGDPRDQPQRRRRGDGDLSREAAEAARRACHADCDGCAGRQRPRVRRRGHDAQGDGRAAGGLSDCAELRRVNRDGIRDNSRARVARNGMTLVTALAIDDAIASPSSRDRVLVPQQVRSFTDQADPVDVGADRGQHHDRRQQRRPARTRKCRTASPIGSR